MFQVDLKKAEVAMAAGRLEEAFERLRSTSGKEHRHGQRLTDRLVDALITRGKIHLDQGRLTDAREDVQRAEQLAGRQVEVASLLHEISLRDDSVAGRANQHATEDARHRLQGCVDANDWEAALRILSQLAPLQSQDAEVQRIKDQIVRRVVERGMQEIRDGRIDQAWESARGLQRIQPVPASVQELRRLIHHCEQAQQQISSGDFREAMAELKRLAHVLPDCEWANMAQADIQSVIEGLTSLEASPLAFLKNGDMTRPRFNAPVPSLKPPAANPRSEAWRDDPNFPSAKQSAPPMVLQVDGVGSMLLIQSEITTLGRSGMAPTPDIVLQGESLNHPIVFQRDGDDYLAESKDRLIVNDQPFDRRLLADGDVMKLGRRGRVRFSKPVAASGSAILHLSGARLSRGDVRHVVLLADSLLLGPPGTHFPVKSATAPIIVQPTSDGLLVHEQGTPQRQALVAGGSVLVGGTRFSISPVVPGRTR